MGDLAHTDLDHPQPKHDYLDPSDPASVERLERAICQVMDRSHRTDPDHWEWCHYRTNGAALIAALREPLP